MARNKIRPRPATGTSHESKTPYVIAGVSILAALAIALWPRRAPAAVVVPAPPPAPGVPRLPRPIWAPAVQPANLTTAAFSPIDGVTRLPAVGTMQWELQGMGQSVATIDGIWGQNTYNSVHNVLTDIGADALARFNSLRAGRTERVPAAAAFYAAQQIDARYNALGRPQLV